MSRIIAAVVLVLLIAGFCISDRIVINNIYEDLYEKISSCEDLAENPEKAGVATKELREKFESSEGVLSMYVNHDILDEIAESVARLEVLSGRSETDYMSECAFIKLKLEYIKKDSGVNLHSIF